MVGILHNRAPLVCKLGAGRMRVRHDDREDAWFIDAGFCQVLDNRVTVLTQLALKPDQIDRTEAQAMLNDARRMPVTDDVSARRKDRTLASARARLRMAGT